MEPSGSPSLPGPPCTDMPCKPSRLRAFFRPIANFWLDALFAIALFVGNFTMPGGVVDQGLDASWSRALQECFKTGAQAGSDYVFTYGPLGAFVSMIYDRHTYWYKYGWELVFDLILTGIMVAFARRLPRIPRLLFYAVALLYLTSLYDLRFEFTMLALAVLLLVGELRVSVLVLSGVFLAVLCLVKFTFAVFAVPAILLVSAWRWWETRRPVVLLLPSAFAMGLIALWLALGQSLLGLPAYALMSMEIARGYVEAMSSSGPEPILVRALVIFAIDLLACLVLVLHARQKNRYLVGAILVLAALHLQFRHGFIRQDDDHCLLFFGFVLTLPFVLAVIEPAALSRWWTWPVFGVTWALAVQAFMVIDDVHAAPLNRRGSRLWMTLHCNAAVLFHPGEHQTGLEMRERVQSAHWQLPKIKAIVGDHTVDMVTFSQGLVFLNEMRWAPRPIFQSYSAYTPKLLAANQAFYRGPLAPEFVLFHLDSIDNRLPATEDGGVLLELLHRYQPVIKEKDYLLLQKRPNADPRQDTPQRTTELTIQMGEEVPITFSPEEYVTASLQFDLRTSGRLLHALYRNPFLFVNLRLSDGSFRGYRLIPGMAAHEFLLSPLVEDNEDFVEAYGKQAKKQVVGLSVTQEEFHGWHPYRSTVHLTLKAYPTSFVPRAPDAVLAPLSRLALLGTFPEHVDGHFRKLDLKGQEGLLVKRGTVTYALRPDQRRISGAYGIVPEDFTAEQKKGGVYFTVVHVSPTGKETELFRHRLAPVESAADRGLHTFSVTLPRHHGGGNLQLHTIDCAHSTCWDWSYWSHIKIQ